MLTEQLTEPNGGAETEKVTSANRFPWRFTKERNLTLSRRPRPGGRPAEKSIRSFQLALLKVITEDQEEIINGEIIKRKAKASEIASAATAWDRLEERRRILSGIGAPKPVAAVNDKTKNEPTKVHELTLDVPEIVPRGTIDPDTTTT